MNVALTRFLSFLQDLTYEYGDNCQFAFVGIETNQQRFPTYDNPDVDLYWEKGDIGIDLVIKETNHDSPLTVTSMIDIVNDALENEGDNYLYFIFKDGSDNVIFETDSWEDYEYSIIYANGTHTTHSFS